EQFLRRATVQKEFVHAVGLDPGGLGSSRRARREDLPYLLALPIWKSPDLMFLKWRQIVVGFARYYDDSSLRQNLLRRVHQRAQVGELFPSSRNQGLNNAIKAKTEVRVHGLIKCNPPFEFLNNVKL